jgi:hypothetical protein
MRKKAFFKCSQCGVRRPLNLLAKNNICILCRPKHVRTQKTIPQKRCYNSWKKVRKRTPFRIPRWVTIEALYPIYERAYQLDLEYPEYKHTVQSIVWSQKGKVCSLLTPKNLRIRRSRRVPL